MPVLETHHEPTWAEACAGLVLKNSLLFRLHFFKDQLGHEPSKEQKLMFCDRSRRVLFCTGRKIAKTVDLEADVIQNGVLHQNNDGGIDEALFFTPNDVHMVPFVDRIFSRLERNAILKGSVRDKRRGDNTVVEFMGGLRWYFRIEGTTGTDKNVVGLRAIRVVGDEQAFGSHTVYRSLLQTALPTAGWKLAGVPNGVRRSPFYDLDQTKLGLSWSRHKYPTFINPLYQTEEAKARLIEDYGGKDTHGYKTQVLGEWGEEMFSSFPAGSIAVGDHPYFARDLVAVGKDRMTDLALMLGVPSIRCQRFAIGLDYGFSPDPSILTLAYGDEQDIWRLYFRLRMDRVPQPMQVEIIRYVITHVAKGAFIGFSSDHLETIQLLQADDTENAHLYLNASPGGSTRFEVNRLRETEPDIYRLLADSERKAEYATIPNKQLYIERFRSWMINATTILSGRQFFLGHDSVVEDELAGTTERKTQAGNTVYLGPADPNDKSRHLDHNLDSLSYLGHAIYVGQLQQAAVFSEDELIEAMGFAGDGLSPEEEYYG